MFEYLKDKWLTWSTGLNKSRREYTKWHRETVNIKAGTVEDYFVNFKHIIKVDYDKIFDPREPFGPVPCEEFRQFQFPIKSVGSNAMIQIFRGWYNDSSAFMITDFGDRDQTFVATNSDEDALMISMKFS